MLATLAETLPTGPGWLYEPKWDGFRCLAIVDTSGSAASLVSRRGTNLNDAFPDVAAAVASSLPAGTIVDGEIVRWMPDGRLDFEALQRRNRTSSRGARELARSEPCHLIIFDVLRTKTDGDVTGLPLASRREILEQLLEDQPAGVVVVGMQTDDLDTAALWRDRLVENGIEGIIAKRANGTYRPGARGWSKIKHYASTEAIIGGVTGPLERPESLVLGRIHTSDGQLHIAGRTTELNPAAAADIAAAIRPAAEDHPWPSQLPPSWNDRQPRPYQRVSPDTVAEIRVDVATSHSDAAPGHWRHRLRFLRLRSDLTIHDVPLDLDLEK